MENCQLPAIAPFCCELLEDELPPHDESVSAAANNIRQATRGENALRRGGDDFRLSQSCV